MLLATSLVTAPELRRCNDSCHESELMSFVGINCATCEA